MYNVDDLSYDAADYLSQYGVALNTTRERRGLWVKAGSGAAPLTVPTNLRATGILKPTSLSNFESEYTARFMNPRKTPEMNLFNRKTYNIT